MAYDRLEPIGEWRADFRMSYLASLITNIAIKVFGEKRQKLTTPKDFLLEWDKEKKAQTIEEMKQILYLIAGKYKK